MKPATWYYDVISPYSYIQSEMLDRLDARLDLTCVPVLFAGLLQHWGTVGPAETPAKRKWTYRQCLWLAGHHGIPMRFPPVHPFNPIMPLRLCVAAALDGRGREAMHAIFRFIWQDARDPVAEFAALARVAGIADPEARVADPAVKDRLRANTDRAAAEGVFGVPSLVIDGEVFWGVDGMPIALDFLDRPDMFDSPEMRRVDALPAGIQRKR